MQRMTGTMIKNGCLAALMALILCTTPAFARSEYPAGDNAAESLNEPSFSTLSSDPALAMATQSLSSDGLANFGPSSGTVVGNRALELRDEILRLRASVNLNSSQFSLLRASGTAGAVQYHSTVAAITARLQNGTTRGNPILLRQWEEANASLGEVTSSLNRLNSLQTSIDSDAALASYLLGSLQAAYQLSGGVDEDQDQLKLLHDEASRLVVQLDYLHNQTTSDIERQSNYLTTERSNLQALAFAISRGELLGNSLANRPVMVTPAPVAAMPYPNTGATTLQQAPLPMIHTKSAPAPLTGATLQPALQDTTVPDTGIATSNPNVGIAPPVGHLLVLIRYNQPVVEYEQQLSKAVGAAMERRPNAEFSVVAVSPSSGNASDLAQLQEKASNNAEDVKRSLIRLGLPPSSITISSTQTQTAETPEVHVYVK